MNDVLMLFFLVGIMFLGLCLIQAIRRMAASDSKRIRRCRQIAAVLFLDVMLLWPGVRIWLYDMCFWLLESEEAKAFRETVFVRRNYEVQYFLVFYLLINLLILTVAFVLFLVLEKVSDRGGIYRFGKLEVKQKIFHLPWILADLCYENRPEGPVLRPAAAVFGKWMWNLSDAMLAVMGVQAVLGVFSIFVKVGWLNGIQGAAVFSGWYLLPSVVWVTAVQIGGFLEYCPKERPDRQRKTAEKTDPVQVQLFALASAGESAAVTRDIISDDWLFLWLYECFQKRKRVAIVCHTKTQENEWRKKLETGLAKQYDKVCLIRFGSVVEMRNQQDSDILLITLSELITLEIDRVFPFWYQQMQAVILVDTHGILSHIGAETDVFFFLWKRKEDSIQYLFFDCFGNAQEKQALEYFAGKKVEIAGTGMDETEELITWELDSQRGQMRRMLLAMQQDQGVSEAWLDEKKKYFGMPGIRTEQFLAHTLKTVFEGYQVQNLYDSFLFIEDPGAVKSSWRVRLTDQGVITMLNQPQAKKIGWEEALPVGMSDTPIISMEDQIYRMKDMIPLALGMEQEKKRLMLYQAVMSYEKRGIFTWPVIGTLPDFTKESYYECRSEQESAYEVTVLRVMLSMRNATEDAVVLSALFSVVCNQVLQKIFPYHADQIKAGCALADEGRSIFCRVLPDEEYMPPMHCVTVDLIETQESERGLTAVLRRNSADFFLACGAWLKRAKSDPLSMESVMLSYAQKQLGKEPDEYHGAEKLLGLLEEESK